MNKNYGLVTDLISTYKSMSMNSVLYGLSWEVASNSHPADLGGTVHIYTFIKTDNPGYNRIIVDAIGYGIFYGKYDPTYDTIDWTCGRSLMVNWYDPSTKTLNIIG